MELLKNIDIKILFFLLPLTLLIHELEEWNIYDYHKKSYESKVIEETKLSARLWLLFLSFVGFIWTIIAYFIPNLSISVIFFMLLIDFTLLNSIQHIGLTVKTKKYNPGFIFGGIVGLAVNCLVIWRIASDKIIPGWGLLLLLLLIIPGLVDTIVNSRKKRLPKMVEAILKFSGKLEKIMTK